MFAVLQFAAGPGPTHVMDYPTVAMSQYAVWERQIAALDVLWACESRLKQLAADVVVATYEDFGLVKHDNTAVSSDLQLGS
ncbi:unnamed protein product [Dibothriocephalus latus]|uniref:Uncharacterized protein n=1 Tax=Dibothriocephalus latus TaxID=60516 RepID=A0A3P6U2J0_DIBLA|nr:unnamed protein product [Dibothriocephalus latus]